MRAKGCAREQDVVNAVRAAAGSGIADPDLREHARDCPACAAIAELARALVAERQAAHAEARIPSSAVVWWRAEMRRRQEATRRVERPIAAVLAVTAISIAAFVVAVVPLFAGWLRSWSPLLAESLPDVSLPSLVDFQPSPETVSLLSSPLALTMIVCTLALLILAPVAIYLTRADH